MNRVLLIISLYSFCLISQRSIFAQTGTIELLRNVSVPTISRLEKIESLNRLSELYSRDSTQKAMQFANQAYILSLQEGNKLLEARSLENLAGSYLYNDNYDQALQYGFKALDLSLQEKSNPDIANCYTGLGWIFFDSENFDFSMQYHRQAYELFKEINDKRSSGSSANAIGLIYRAKSNYDSARFYFDTALSIAKETGNKSGEAASLNNIGICENDQGRHEEAIRFFNQSLLIPCLNTINKPPTRVVIGGKEYNDWQYNETNRTVIVSFNKNVNDKTIITVYLKN